MHPIPTGTDEPLAILSLSRIVWKFCLITAVESKPNEQRRGDWGVSLLIMIGESYPFQTTQRHLHLSQQRRGQPSMRTP